MREGSECAVRAQTNSGQLGLGGPYTWLMASQSSSKQFKLLRFTLTLWIVSEHATTFLPPWIPDNPLQFHLFEEGLKSIIIDSPSLPCIILDTLNLKMVKQCPCLTFMSTWLLVPDLGF